MGLLERVEEQARDSVNELAKKAGLGVSKLLVVGCSTSEIDGKHIGKGSCEELAAVVFQGIQEVQSSFGFSTAFQCCEHLNRALVVDRLVMERLGLEEVTVVPIPSAGGAMASFAFTHMDDPLVVETIVADAGIDIGDTFIGMHLRRVVVPVRLSVHNIGEAHVTAARTRPRLIGGARATYEDRGGR